MEEQNQERSDLYCSVTEPLILKAWEPVNSGILCSRHFFPSPTKKLNKAPMQSPHRHSEMIPVSAC